MRSPCTHRVTKAETSEEDQEQDQDRRHRNLSICGTFRSPRIPCSFAPFSSSSCDDIMMNVAEFLVTPENFLGNTLLRTELRVSSTEEPEEQFRQRQHEQINPACHRNQRHAEECAFECELSDPCKRHAVGTLCSMSIVDSSLRKTSKTNSTISGSRIASRKEMQSDFSEMAAMCRARAT